MTGLVCGADKPDTTADTITVTAASSPQVAAAAIAQAQQREQAALAQKDEPGLVKALNDEAEAHLRIHEFDAAEKLRLQVLHLEEEHSGKNSLPVADALLNIGWFNNNMAHYEAAQEALDRCREIRERILGSESAPVAEVLNALGDLEENRSNLTLAEAFYLQAITVQEKVLGLQSPVTANTWNNLATLYWITGDYASAQRYFTRALAVKEKSFGANSPVVATTLNNLALLDSSLGDYDEAESYFQRALRIRSNRLGPDHPFTITTLSQLGQLYVSEGDDARAEPLLLRAVQMREKTYGNDHPDVARSLMQLALLYDRKKEFANAEPLLIQALDIRRRTLGTEHPEYAASLVALARHNHAEGKLQEALPLYQQALKIDREALGDNHPDTVDTATDLIYLDLELGLRDEANRLAGDVIEAQQNALNGVFAFAPERQRLDFKKIMQPCELPAALDDPDLLAQVILRTKGVVLDSLLEDEAATRAARDPDVQALMEKKRLLSARLSQAQEESGADFSDSPDALADRQRLEQEERDLETSLAEKGIDDGRTRRALGTDVSEVRDALPDDAALVEFVAYRRYIGRLDSEPAYGVMVLTRNGPAKWIPLLSEAEIDAQVHTYQKYVRRHVHEAVLSDALTTLYQSLAKPVVDSLPVGIHRLILSPDANLNFVSFATLLDDKDHFFGEDFELNYVSSGRDLIEERKSVASDRKMVVFADPDYLHGSTVAASEDDPFDPLPGTEREATFLQQVAKSDGIGIEVYRGADASKANLAKQDSPYVLHLATHGLYLSPDDVPNLPPSPTSTGAVAPSGAAADALRSMSRSLLALEGASVTLRDWKKGIFPPPDNDGLLTAQEVSSLNLDRTWLVVLSACDSGGGEAQAGEGVFGLRRGFAEAGAQNLLMTLWTVDDASTASLMEEFYREALRTGDAPGALAQVQRARLVEVRKKSGLSEAVRQAGPFILSY